MKLTHLMALPLLFGVSFVSFACGTDTTGSEPLESEQMEEPGQMEEPAQMEEPGQMEEPAQMEEPGETTDN